MYDIRLGNIDVKSFDSSPQIFELHECSQKLLKYYLWQNVIQNITVVIIGSSNMRRYFKLVYRNREFENEFANSP